MDTDKEGSLVNRLYHLVSALVTLALPQIALLSRYVRQSSRRSGGSTHNCISITKGLRSRRVIMKHALRNALIPLITVLGVPVPGLVSGRLSWRPCLI